MLPRFGRILRAAAIIAITAITCLAAPTPRASAALKSWRDGPVRVFLSADEYERFGALRTDDERREFIDRFWREMQASPGTAGKDFRTTFEERCAVANERFQTIREEGWQTDRGKVYVALGEPTTIRHESGGLKADDKEVWIYGAASDPAASLEIAFYRCKDGSYRADPSCLVARDPNSVSFDWERINYLRTLRDNNPGLSSGRVRQLLNELLAALPRTIPRTGEAPATSGDVTGTAAKEVAEGESSSNRLEAVPYYFRAQDGSVLVFLTLEVREDPGAADPTGDDAHARYLAAASFEEADRRGVRLPGVAVRTTPLDPVARAGPFPTFFGRTYLESGKTYVARYALKDGARGEILVKNAVVTVPDLRAGFSASSLVPAERFGPAGGPPGVYQVGSEEIVPRVGAAFRRSELLRLYLQVYGAAVDSERSMARVDVVFRFQRVVKGTPKRFGKPFSVRQAAGAAMGLALPIGDWPPGPYRVSVELHDRVGGEHISVPGSFSIVDD